MPPASNNTDAAAPADVKGDTNVECPGERVAVLYRVTALAVTPFSPTRRCSA
jgi:hypothetical protein